MSRVRLVGRLVARDLRNRPGQALLMLLAITAATATLTLGLVLHGVTSQPYQQTRAATRGPDELAYLGTPALPTERVWTVGANYYLNPNVVFKIDYQDFNHDDVALGYGNRFDLGIGYQF